MVFIMIYLKQIRENKYIQIIWASHKVWTCLFTSLFLIVWHTEREHAGVSIWSTSLALHCSCSRSGLLFYYGSLLLFPIWRFCPHLSACRCWYRSPAPELGPACETSAVGLDFFSDPCGYSRKDDRYLDGFSLRSLCIWTSDCDRWKTFSCWRNIYHSVFSSSPGSLLDLSLSFSCSLPSPCFSPYFWKGLPHLLPFFPRWSLGIRNFGSSLHYFFQVLTIENALVSSFNTLSIQASSCILVKLHHPLWGFLPACSGFCRSSLQIDPFWMTEIYRHKTCYCSQPSHFYTWVGFAAVQIHSFSLKKKSGLSLYNFARSRRCFLDWIIISWLHCLVYNFLRSYYLHVNILLLILLEKFCQQCYCFQNCCSPFSTFCSWSGAQPIGFWSGLWWKFRVSWEGFPSSY